MNESVVLAPLTNEMAIVPDIPVACMQYCVSSSVGLKRKIWLN
jgi:hypothetical protein